MANANQPPLVSPLVSVIMPTYNAQKYLREAVASVLAQTYQHFELILVDDGSTDATDQIARELTRQSDKIRYFQNSRNLGIAAATNVCFKHARGELVAMHDSDDVSLPNRFEVQVAYLQSNPQVAVLGSGWKIIRRDGGHKIHRPRIAAPTFDDMMNRMCFAHPTLMMRTAALPPAGYDSRFHYVSDYDFTIRMSKSHRCANLPDVLYVLRDHDTRTSNDYVEVFLETILAQRNALGKVSDALFAKIARNGLQSFYDHLTADEKDLYYANERNFHLRLARLHYKNAGWAKSFYHFGEWRKLGGCHNLKTAYRMTRARIKSRPHQSWQSA